MCLPWIYPPLTGWVSAWPKPTKCSWPNYGFLFGQNLQKGLAKNRLEVLSVIYPYITLADGTEIVYTNVFEEDGLQKVEVHFERPTENGFDTARCQLPSYKWIIRDGFTDEEMKIFDQFMHSNAHLFYKYGANGGLKIA